MTIECPHCGVRPIEEFAMHGDASKARPAGGDPSEMDAALTDQWHDYIYLRDNPKGRFEEYWHHAGGCRSWLVVTRDTVTHEVFSVVTAREHAHARLRETLS